MLTKVIVLISKFKKVIVVFAIYGTKGKTVSKLKVWNDKKIHPIPKVKKTSAILLTTIAFNAAFVAFIRVYQKLINKYEHKPTPSQPKKS